MSFFSDLSINSIIFKYLIESTIWAALHYPSSSDQHLRSSTLTYLKALRWCSFVPVIQPGLMLIRLSTLLDPQQAMPKVWSAWNPWRRCPLVAALSPRVLRNPLWCHMPPEPTWARSGDRPFAPVPPINCLGHPLSKLLRKMTYRWLGSRKSWITVYIAKRTIWNNKPGTLKVRSRRSQSFPESSKVKPSSIKKWRLRLWISQLPSNLMTIRPYPNIKVISLIR